jgi:uncharacterized membrane protein
MNDIIVSDAAQATDSERQILLIAYALHGAAVLNGLTAIAGVIVNHIKINETHNHFVRSHHRWLIRTFWFGLLWTAVSAALSLLLVGFLGFVIVGVWWLYRVIRGVLAYTDGKPMPMPAGL